MGARLYNPGTGRFLTTDPVPGGNANPYTYPTDPINSQDLDGKYSWQEKFACAAIGMGSCYNAHNIANYVFEKFRGKRETNRRNAKRHFVWNFMLMAQIGRLNTMIVTDAHEAAPSSREAQVDSDIDHWNNSLVQRTQESNARGVNVFDKYRLNRLWAIASAHFKRAWAGKYTSRKSFACKRKGQMVSC